MKKQNHYKLALELLSKLHNAYPSFGLGRHLSTALSDYGDFWGITDKELLFALQKYEAELALDQQNIADEEYVNQIVKEGMDLDTILNEEEE